MNLSIGRNASDASAFNLPVETVTATIAILAMKGKGKTYTASVLAEEMLKAGQVPIVIDYTGAWSGLKSSADGKSAGFPVVIFGGEHADLPLESTAGEVVARAIVEGRFPAVLDMTLFRKAESNRFLGEFLETLYRANRQAVHLICDEADAYAPQRPGPEQARTLGAMEDIVRRGRIRGIGCTLITQRPAVLNKNVLTQCEVLVALGLSHNLDIKAIREWIEVNGSGEQEDLMLKDLPSLAKGRAYVWAPSWNIFSKVIVRQRETFDSSATPKPGQTRAEPKGRAEIDIASLGQQIQQTVERARENDPKLLRAEIAQLKKQLVNQPLPEPRIVTKPAISEQDRQAIKKLFAGINESHQTCINHLDAMLAVMRPLIEKGQADLVETPISTRVIATPPAEHPHVGLRHNSVAGLGKCESAILTALTQYGSCTKERLGPLSGYSANSGGFNNALAKLRSAGYLEPGSPISTTGMGLKAIGVVTPKPTGRDLLEHWCGKVGKCERAILEVLYRQHTMSKEELGHATGYSPDSGGFNNALASLRTLELIRRGNPILINEEVFS